MRLGVLVACAVVALAGTAVAKGNNGRGGGRQDQAQDVGCAVLLDPAIDLGAPFVAVVRRVPSYPGQWWAPSITWTVSVPMLPGYEEQTLSARKVFRRIVSANRAEADFVIADAEGVDLAGEVLVQVTVDEQHQAASCEATTVFAQ